MILQGTALETAVHETLVCLLPEERHGLAEDCAEGGTVTVSLTREGGDFLCRVQAVRGGEERTGECRLPPEGDSPLEQKRVETRAVKTAVYRAVVGFLPQPPVWGAMSGVKPAKPLRQAFPQGIEEEAADAFLKERQILQPLKERANYTINTGLLSTSQNKERICDLFMKNGGAKNAMRLTIMSFGFKFGLPPEADLVLDVRCLPNPFYVPELKHKTGLDQEVVDFVMGYPEAQELLRRYENFLQYALPLYVKEGKSQLTIAVGCTGGKHRSITFARKLAEYCTSLGYEPGVQHRDAVR